MTEEQVSKLRIALLEFVWLELHRESPGVEILILPKIARIAVESGLLQKEHVYVFKDALLEFITKVADKPLNSYQVSVLPEIVELLIDFDSLYPN